MKLSILLIVLLRLFDQDFQMSPTPAIVFTGFNNFNSELYWALYGPIPTGQIYSRDSSGGL